MYYILCDVVKVVLEISSDVCLVHGIPVSCTPCWVLALYFGSCAAFSQLLGDFKPRIWRIIFRLYCSSFPRSGRSGVRNRGRVRIDGRLRWLALIYVDAFSARSLDRRPRHGSTPSPVSGWLPYYWDSLIIESPVLLSLLLLNLPYYWVSRIIESPVLLSLPYYWVSLIIESPVLLSLTYYWVSRIISSPVLLSLPYYWVSLIIESPLLLCLPYIIESLPYIIVSPLYYRVSPYIIVSPLYYRVSSIFSCLPYILCLPYSIVSSPIISSVFPYIIVFSPSISRVSPSISRVSPVESSLPFSANVSFCL